MTGSALVLLGIGYALLPSTWLEADLHIDPDAGSGSAEALISLGLVGAGAALLVRPLLRAWSARRAATAAGHSSADPTR
jgi:hypothetical protein